MTENRLRDAGGSMYPPQVRHEDALLRASTLSAQAESFEERRLNRKKHLYLLFS